LAVSATITGTAGTGLQGGKIKIGSTLCAADSLDGAGVTGSFATNAVCLVKVDPDNPTITIGGISTIHNFKASYAVFKGK